jgi:hypothetical protein
LGGKGTFAGFTNKLYLIEWVINIQAPFGKPEKVLEYLSRYVFRIAITDRRIIEVKDGKVRFSWKDYRTGQFRKMNLDIDEFIRRFLLHVLPQGFFKVRYYGILASRLRRQNIELSRKLLIQEQDDAKQETFEDGKQTWEKQDTVWNELLQIISNYRQPNCPHCHKGRLYFAGIVLRTYWEPG